MTLYKVESIQLKAGGGGGGGGCVFFLSVVRQPHTGAHLNMPN